MTCGRAALALTFDDGPRPESTPQVLQELGDRAIAATFFVLGSRVREAPALIDEILAGGHRVELHGDVHLDHRTASYDELAADTQSALSTLQAAGVQPTWWRLPWGRPGPATEAVARNHNLAILGWDIDPHDWRGDRWEDQPNHRVAALQRGGVVLLHDAIGPGSPRPDCSNTIELVAAIAREAAEAGVGFIQVPDPSAVRG